MVIVNTMNMGAQLDIDVIKEVFKRPIGQGREKGVKEKEGIGRGRKERRGRRWKEGRRRRRKEGRGRRRKEGRERRRKGGRV